MTARVLVRATLAAVGVAGAIACAVTYVSGERFSHALDRSLATGQFAGVLRDLRASDSPLNPTAHRDGAISLALLALGRTEAAERVAARSARREPDNADTWALLARIQVSRGHTRAARASWDRAYRLAPTIGRALPRPVRVAPSSG